MVAPGLPAGAAAVAAAGAAAGAAGLPAAVGAVPAAVGAAGLPAVVAPAPAGGVPSAAGGAPTPDAEPAAPDAALGPPDAVSDAPEAVPAAPPAADEGAFAPPAEVCPAVPPFVPATFVGSPRSPSPPPPPPPQPRARNRPTTESAATPRMLDCMPVWYGDAPETGRTGVRRRLISGGNLSLEVAGHGGATNRERAGASRARDARLRRS